MMRHTIALTVVLAMAVSSAQAQDRNTKVRNDRKQIDATGLWIYNDLSAGIAKAKKTRKPLLIVFR